MRGRAVVVHELAQAVAALAAAADCGRPVTLLSAAGAAAYAGAGWFAALVRLAAARVPAAEHVAILDCGRRADLVQAALRQGLRGVAYGGPAATAARLADIARQLGGRLYRRRPPALDLLGEPDPYRACRDWLAATAKTRRPRRPRG